jgi:serine/threonine protein kinase
MDPQADITVHCAKEIFCHVQEGQWEVKPEEIQRGDKIDEGANAVIVKAVFRGRLCAAKQLKNGVSTNTQAYKDLVTELDVLTSLTAHPNIVQFLGASISFTDRPVMLEEYVRGPNLEKFLSGVNRAHRQYLEGAYLAGRKDDKLERRTIFGWCLDLLKALDFLHDRNPIIMHRDLKPANLLLSGDLSVLKLADFGMAKKVDRARRDTAQHRGHTGTVRYTAPTRAGNPPFPSPSPGHPPHDTQRLTLDELPGTWRQRSCARSSGATTPKSATSTQQPSSCGTSRPASARPTRA